MVKSERIFIINYNIRTWNTQIRSVNADLTDFSDVSLLRNEVSVSPE